ncbi:serine protease [Massilia sp. W12]|uniref:trypsin-like serine peptidase n=1 Tax=Massilia sp. W12 TaxID=3126507 RepID=UPI0030CCCCBC
MKFTSLCAAFALSFAVAPAFAGTAVPAPLQVAQTHAHDVTLAPHSYVLREQGGLLRKGYAIRHEISHPGADFIKVHFAHVKLPAGAKISVSSRDGKEIYHYDGRQNTHATWDSEQGEDGLRRFSAMSVFGDSAIITVHLAAGSKWNERLHSVKIDHYQAGDMRAQEAQISPFSTCGANQRRDAVCYASSHPTEYGKSRPVARMLINGIAFCSTWRVGPQNLMLTNNHCISGAAGPSKSEIWFNYQNTKCGVKGQSGVIKVRGSSMLKTSKALDYSLYTLNNFSAVSSFGYLSLDVRDAAQSERIYIPQHGQGNPKEMALHSDVNSSGMCEIDVPQSGVDTGYKCDTAGGSSGSPVIAAQSHKVIALHHIGNCPNATNTGVLIKNIWPEIASYFGNVIP